ncbi:PQQ-binding-like beta-propeller repeat protein [Micromonospora sp. NPDC092111]|uniref:outer membrane protein assembly factor BamB family protein n=1 Tax=Micromonospora sp. NPDC092111 TaxID=3364289 RepID=UPI0037F7D7F1
MTVIDLGELGHDELVDLPPRPPRPVGRQLRAALLTVLVLLTVAAAAPAPARLARIPVPDLPEPAHLVVGDLLVLTGPRTLAPTAGQLTAVDLADGRIRWRAPLPDNQQLVVLDEVGDDMVVSTDPGGEPVTMLLDHADGRVRWRQPGSAVSTGNGGLLLEDVEVDGVTVRGVDPASGAVRWSVGTGAATPGYRAGARGIEELVLVTAAGRVEVYDVDTGVRRLTFAVPPAHGDSRELAQVAGDVLLVDEEPGRAAGYDLDTGRRRWVTPLVPHLGTPFAYSCGDAVCLGAPSGARVLDPVTGRLRWAADDWAPLFTVGDWLLGARADGQQRESFALLDPATGRVHADLGGWRLVQGRPGTTVFVTRPLAGGRQLLAELDVGSGALRVRDVLPERWELCSHHADVLVCWRRGDSLGVWRLPG